MHELSVCLALMEQVHRIAGEHRAQRVEQVVVRLGPLSGVEAPLLQRAWPLAVAGTLAANAELVIETMPVKVRCSGCDAISETVANRLVCAYCGDFRTRLVSGDEMLLATLSLYRGDNEPAPGGSGADARQASVPAQGSDGRPV